MMRIDRNQGALALAEVERSGSRSAASVNSQEAARSELGEDRAQLWETHRQTQALTVQALQLPEIRQEKVNALRQVVQDGSYQLNSDQIAEAVFARMVMPAA